MIRTLTDTEYDDFIGIVREAVPPKKRFRRGTVWMPYQVADREGRRIKGGRYEATSLFGFRTDNHDHALAAYKALKKAGHRMRQVKKGSPPFGQLPYYFVFFVGDVAPPAKADAAVAEWSAYAGESLGGRAWVQP
jgi:hypothetical protein